MFLYAPHTLGVAGVGPRTFRDSYEIARFEFMVMSEIVAARLSDYDYVNEGFMARYREARDTYVSVRAAYLGI